jgi:hypothetical protein
MKGIDLAKVSKFSIVLHKSNAKVCLSVAFQG